MTRLLAIVAALALVAVSPRAQSVTVGPARPGGNPSFISSTAFPGIGGGVTSVAQGSIGVAIGTASGTFTIPAVATGSSVVFVTGWNAPNCNAFQNNAFGWVELTNATTVTGHFPAGDGSCVGTISVEFQVLEFKGGLVKSNQDVAINLQNVTSATAVISSVVQSRTLVFFRGYAGGGNLADAFSMTLRIAFLSDATHVGAIRVTSQSDGCLVYATALEFL